MSTTATKRSDVPRAEYLAYLRKKEQWYFLTATRYRTHRDRELAFGEGHRFLKAIYADKSRRMVIKKSTQCGVSEYLIVRLLTDTRTLGDNVFYVLPTGQLKNRFVQNRVDRSVMYSGLRESAEGKSLGGGGFGGNLSLKFFGKGSVTFGGSNSSAVFTEYPADVLIIDELDECDEDNLAMAVERLSASENRRECRVGNPTIERVGIDAEFRKSDQKEWHVKCPGCGKLLVLDWFLHVVGPVKGGGYELLDYEWTEGCGRDVAMFCDTCDAELDRFSRGWWIPQNPDSRISGYHISKLFSTNTTIEELWERFQEGQVKAVVLQRFYNGDLGIAYTAPGAKITEKLLDEAIADHTQSPPKAGRCVMGVDVGSMINVWVAQLVPHPELKLQLRTVLLTKVKELADVEEIWRSHRCIAGVIDALPEERMSRRATVRMRGMFRCYYGSVRRDISQEDQRMITVQRTPALDAIRESLMTGGTTLPKDARSVPNFYDEMTAGTRKYDVDRGVYVWDEGSSADHYHHAGAYLVIARNLVGSQIK